MEQHPIPGAITTYKFKLVGDMTLKQFLELAFGVVTAWIILNSSVNPLIKWSLGPFFGFLGFALAFLPIEDRPLDHWIINFIKAIYSPTQFLYRPTAKKLTIFEPVKKIAPVTAVIIRSGQNQQLGDFLESLPQSATSVFDQAESRYLEYVANLFGAVGNHPVADVSLEPQPQMAVKTNLKGVRVRRLSQPQFCLLPQAVIFQAPAEPIQAAMPAVPMAKPMVKSIKIKPSPAILPPVKKPEPVTPPPAPAPTKATNTIAPSFAADAILPEKPERPNLIAGITVDKDNKIIPGVILEIRDNQGFPVRALRSNKLGQFFIATPLPDGIYEIHAEQGGFQFAIIRLEAKNEIIPPLKIQAAP